MNRNASSVSFHESRSRSFRLAIVLSHPTQYYSPWFRWLRLHTSLDFRVFYLWEFGVRPTRDTDFQTTFAWDVDLLSGYDYEFVPNVASNPGTHHFGGLHNPSLHSRLKAWRPTAVLLFGYACRSNLSVIAWARLHRVPLLFRGDSHFIGRGSPPWSRRFALGLLYAQFAAFTYVGLANRDYFRALGVPEGKLFFAPHAVDADLFDPSRRQTIAAAADLRAHLRLPPKMRVVLFAGKLIPAKQPRELLEAFLTLRPVDAALVFVGDGEERGALEKLAANRPEVTVRFLPFANQSEMPARYLMADVFALPSRGLYETWGLAVNEAMHMGVPCLVSDRVGCQRDLVADGETGWVFRAEQPDELADRLVAALAVDLLPLKPRIHAKIAGYTYAVAARGLEQALAEVCSA